MNLFGQIFGGNFGKKYKKPEFPDFDSFPFLGTAVDGEIVPKQIEEIDMLGSQPAQKEPEPTQDIFQLSLKTPSTLRSSGTVEQQTQNLNEVYNVVKEVFPEKTAISSILGSIQVEAPSFGYTQKEDGVTVGGEGLFQFTAGHRDWYKEYRQENNLEDSILSQMKYVREAIYGKGKYTERLGYGNAEKIREAFEGDDPQLAADMLLDRFFNPEKKDTRKLRRTYSQEFYNQLGN